MYFQPFNCFWHAKSISQNFKWLIGLFSFEAFRPKRFSRSNVGNPYNVQYRFCFAYTSPGKREKCIMILLGVLHSGQQGNKAYVGIFRRICFSYIQRTRRLPCKRMLAPFIQHEYFRVCLFSVRYDFTRPVCLWL